MKSEISSKILDSLSSNKLHLILFPTEQCNFRCTYCYEDFQIGRMHRDVIDSVKALIGNRCQQLNSLKISWFGGEPLAAKSVVYEISEHITKIQRENSELLYGANMTTNGSLLDAETFITLSRLGVQSYQISLDGDEDIHNQSRIDIQGKGTFQKIWNNLLAIRDLPAVKAKIMLRVHFTPINYQSVIPLIDKINEEFSEDQRFSVFFKAIERLGSDSDDEIDIFTSEKQANEVIRYLYSHLTKKDMAANTVFGSNYICYASKANSLAIRANGDIAKCTVALSDERNRIGHLNKDGTIDIDNELLRPWLMGLESGNPAELACPHSILKRS